jgi:hypothetical protein
VTGADRSLRRENAADLVCGEGGRVIPFHMVDVTAWIVMMRVGRSRPRFARSMDRRASGFVGKSPVCFGIFSLGPATICPSTHRRMTERSARHDDQ